MSDPVESTACVIAGGGPAGMMLGLLLARGGVAVTVLEKHADFLRDFRGDTVHASTLRLLDELGLSGEFARVPHRLIDKVTVTIQDTVLEVGLDRLPGAHQHIALVPQWDFLELLARAAAAEPTFRLLRSSEVLGALRDGTGRVTGVRYRGADGEVRELRAELTVACDGRASILRDASGLRTRSFGAPMDVWWFRLPRYDTDPHGLTGIFRSGHGCALIDRGDYFQIAYLIPKGADQRMRAEGIEAFRREVTGLLPWLGDRLTSVESFDDVKLLDVQLNRLRRWYTDGLLLIGDAAHAMSPIGGVGINLAVADAVAAARILAGPLRDGTVRRRHLAAVQTRRWLPAALIQRVQRLVQDRAIAAAFVAGDATGPAPRAVKMANRLPALRRAVAYGVAIGPLPENAPTWARR
ncbi:FAD-dependent oxidoreductase [Mycobacterium sp. NPDC050551]|uniref:FAD-dependent oxidoreductase n=1 Tax=Mycobacterium sp. NPDC050551 TaxID=3155407 RepID=UPI00342583BD